MYVPLLLYNKLSALSVPQKLVDPLLPGTLVLIYNANSMTIIAHGHLSSPDVHPSVYKNIKLTISHILVKILEVHVPGTIINSHQKCMLTSFGTVPFQLVCLWSHVCSYDPLRDQLPTVSMAETSDISTSCSAPDLDVESMNPADGDSDQGAGTLMQEPGESSSQNISQIGPNDRDMESQAYGNEIISLLAAIPWLTAICSCVLKDIFHLFNMLRLSPKHALQKDFTFTL